MEGDIDKVVIIPVGGQSHTENNAPWTICSRDMHGIDSEGIVTFDVIAYDHQGRSIQKQLTIDYDPDEPVEPEPVDTINYITKQHFDSVMNMVFREVIRNREYINRK